MNRLLVYLNDRPAGELVRAENESPVFTYDVGYLTSKAIPLSRQLPLQEEPFSGPPVRAFFAGILPESQVRDQIAAIFGISPGNDWALIEHLGGECAGAVSLLTPDSPPPTMQTGELKWMKTAELETIIAELPRRPLLAGHEGIRLSLAGAQTKLPVVLPVPGIEADGVAALPVKGAASTHIIKPEPARFPGLAANEAYCMALARAVGLRAAEAEWRVIGETPCLIVRRYDREITSGGNVRRLHQEDFCQALGYPPERKYEQEGGPSLLACLELLREWSSVPASDISQFLDAIIFAVLIGNADAHGKNFSFLYAENNRFLAPLYDQVCTLAWPELSKRLSMKIGSAEILPEVEPQHFKYLASKARLSWNQTRDRLIGMCEKLSQAIGEVPIPDKSVQSVSEFIHQRVERMQRLLQN